jgi:S-adenosylmethionine:tRNA ribosyltransferase-isomerase
MFLSEFDYHLPPELIAQHPIEPRDHSRLLVLDRKKQSLEEKRFYDLADLLGKSDVLVVNETRVLNARLKGTILGTGTLERVSIPNICEIFLHKKLFPDTWDCLVYPGKKLKVGTKISFN